MVIGQAVSVQPNVTTIISTAHSSLSNYCPTIGTTSSPAIWQTPVGSFIAFGSQPDGKIKLKAGVYELEDGSELTVDDDGLWTLKEAEKKKVYKGNPVLAFNRFVNASDILEEFILFVRSLGISGDSIFDLPLRLFIMYLIVEASKRDNDAFEDDEAKLKSETLALKAPSQQRCGYCGRFLSAARVAKRFYFCSGAHMDALDRRSSI